MDLDYRQVLDLIDNDDLSGVQELEPLWLPENLDLFSNIPIPQNLYVVCSLIRGRSQATSTISTHYRLLVSLCVAPEDSQVEEYWNLLPISQDRIDQYLNIISRWQRWDLIELIPKQKYYISVQQSYNLPFSSYVALIEKRIETLDQLDTYIPDLEKSNLEEWTWNKEHWTNIQRLLACGWQRTYSGYWGVALATGTVESLKQLDRPGFLKVPIYLSLLMSVGNGHIRPTKEQLIWMVERGMNQTYKYWSELYRMHSVDALVWWIQKTHDFPFIHYEQFMNFTTDLEETNALSLLLDRFNVSTREFIEEWTLQKYYEEQVYRRMHDQNDNDANLLSLTRRSDWEEVPIQQVEAIYSILEEVGLWTSPFECLRRSWLQELLKMKIPHQQQLVLLQPGSVRHEMIKEAVQLKYSGVVSRRFTDEELKYGDVL